jgi:hypothetical protein
MGIEPKTANGRRRVILREECWLGVFVNRILRRIFGSKRIENREWRRLHN